MIVMVVGDQGNVEENNGESNEDQLKIENNNYFKNFLGTAKKYENVNFKNIQLF